MSRTALNWGVSKGGRCNVRGEDWRDTGQRRTHYKPIQRSLGRPWLLALSIIIAALLMLACPVARAAVTGSISGTVKDASGGVVPGARISATSDETGVVSALTANGQGYFSFPSLAVGHYSLKVEHSGYRSLLQTGIVLDVDSALVVDSVLLVGAAQEVVQVLSNAVEMDTASTQLGEVITGNQMTSVPLVSRSYTDLLGLQPGVVSSPSQITGAYAGSFNAAGFAVPQVSGDLNSGGLSVNGAREANNAFLLNGATVQEFGFGGSSVIPNLDSIAEFRIITNNFDAEYGNYNGGQINVITKSGANKFHGNLFEFLRNTDFDAANYFDPQSQRGAYHQNQFGGTVGGPIIHNKIFFFGDYQGNRRVQGVIPSQVTVPSVAERSGDFSAVAANLTGSVQGPLWASQLSNALGYPVAQGEPYYAAGCSSSADCVFPGAQIPASAFSPISQNLFKYIPVPNNGSTYGSSAFPLRLSDNKVSGRIDGNNSWLGALSAYYYLDKYTLISPYPTANVPGFSGSGKGGTNVANVGDTKTFGGSAVNDARIEFVRNNLSLNQPSGGKGVTLSSLGFSTSGNGVIPLDTEIQGVPEIDFGSGLVIGVPSRPNRLIENIYQGVESFSKVLGTHTIKVGGTFHYTQLVEQLDNVLNGNFVFNGTESGVDFADFLIGAPSNFNQGAAPPSNGRSKYLGVYAQDSWRANSKLTLNYGVRWDVSTPWYEQHNEIETIIPGEQSLVFPGAPRGWVFPTDPNVPRTLAPTTYDNFGPRIGAAYSYDPKTTLRAGYGLIYSSFEGATGFNEIGDAPYGFFYSASSPNYTTPFVDRGTGNVEGQKFPVVFPPQNVSAKSPDTTLDWSRLTPIGSSPGFYYKNRLPYAENYELSMERELSASTLLTLSYVGTQGHRLLATMESNPGNPAQCLALSTASAVAPGSPTCGPGLESTVFTTASGQTVEGTRLPIFGIEFQSNGYFVAAAQSAYNSLQVDLRHSGHSLETLMGYTWSKSQDDASGYGEQVNPIVPKRSMALSAFNSTNNFVASYKYTLPSDRVPGPRRLVQGWSLSGITRFSTGLPITLYETDDRSLLGTQFAGPIPLGIDTPNFTGGGIKKLNPRSGGGIPQYFGTSNFSVETLGQLGNARRRFFNGPGTNNWDMALLKNTGITEWAHLEFRAEFFNVFNHTQFSAVNGNINSSSFGTVTSANPPRIGQLSLKLAF